MSASNAYRKLTQAELMTEATARFGSDPLDIAFQCPSCGDVATVREWKAVGEEWAAGRGCIGRVSVADREAAGITRSGCNWAAYGLISGPWKVVIPATPGLPERSVWGFALADGPRPGAGAIHQDCLCPGDTPHPERGMQPGAAAQAHAEGAES